MNKNNNLNYKPYNISEYKSEKTTNFNIINENKGKNNSKNSLFNINNNIALESEYRKSKIYLNEEKNSNEKMLNNYEQSSLKEYVNKQVKDIKKNPDYIKNKRMQKKKEKSNQEQFTNQNNYIINNNTYINDSNYVKFNFNNKLSKSNNKNNKTKKKSKKKSDKSNIITINLRDELSRDKNK